MSEVRCIIPAAGFGTRMNMDPGKSKELLIDPVTNKPVIQWAIDLCKEYDLHPLVITRKEKMDLLNYCDENCIANAIIEPEGEWPNTIYMMKQAFYEDNILILPDTRFNPTSILKDIKTDLELGAKFSIALHKVEDSSKWCIVKDYQIVEKPELNQPAWAMGLIGFKAQPGIGLFSTLSSRNVYKILQNTSFQYLKDFKDITRTGKIEKY